MKIKNILCGLLAVSVIFLSIASVSANKITFGLTLRQGQFYATDTELFTVGTHSVDISFDAWYDTSCTNSKVEISLTETSTGKTLGSVKTGVSLYSCYYHSFGYYTSGYRSYSFDTSIYENGQTINYCGFVSRSVSIGT